MEALCWKGNIWKHLLGVSKSHCKYPMRERESKRQRKVLTEKKKQDWKPASQLSGVTHSFQFFVDSWSPENIQSYRQTLTLGIRV